jgi:hypothetical protein
VAEKFKVDNKEYEVSQLSEYGKSQLSALQFVTERITELTDNRALLIRAKNSYIDSLRQEMLTEKAGFLFGDN